MRLDDPADKGETYFYTVDPENKLVLVSTLLFKEIIKFERGGRNISLS